jgi:hypothetical protein
MKGFYAVPKSLKIQSDLHNPEDYTYRPYERCPQRCVIHNLCAKKEGPYIKDQSMIQMSTSTNTGETKVSPNLTGHRGPGQ